jgi:hypothetical protein
VKAIGEYARRVVARLPRPPEPPLGPAEWDCARCGRHIIGIGLTKPPPGRLCAHCKWWPGWVNDPRLRRILDPEGNARPLPKDGDGGPSG